MRPKNVKKWLLSAYKSVKSISSKTLNVINPYQMSTKGCKLWVTVVFSNGSAMHYWLWKS